MRDDENGLPMLPKKRKAVLNTGAVVTWVLVILIAVFACLIIKDLRGGRGQTVVPAITDTVYTAVQATATPAPLRPEAEGEGLLPIFYGAGTDEKKVALTLDGTLSASDMETLLENAAEYGAKLTFFPNGSELAKNRDFWAAAVLMGHEIENHGYTGKRVSSMTDEEMKNEVDEFTAVLRSFVGESYNLHFMRTDYLDDDTNPALNAYLIARGYLGIARWNVYKPAGFEEIAPGQIICADLDNTALDRVTAIMRVLSENGYEIVTLNSLFDYPENIISSADS